MDVVEWREWFKLLAQEELLSSSSSLREEDQKKKKCEDNEDYPRSATGDAREKGTPRYWRFHNQHLVRYLTWPAGKDYDEKEAEEEEEQQQQQRAPALLLTHGFAASAEQWERFVYALRRSFTSEDGRDTTPPVFAIDLLGFGHSEKPGVSYTQYLWESQIVDFALEVMDATPMVLAGNSIGGGISAGAAASLGPTICRGLVLLNTAGVLQDPLTYAGYPNSPRHASYTEAALAGNVHDDTDYAPVNVPGIGNGALDVFGDLVVRALYPSIQDRLRDIYHHGPRNADDDLVNAVKRAALYPGSANVVGSGQKLAQPQRPLNELLSSSFNKVPRTLAVVGLDDRVSSPAVAKLRADLFGRMDSSRVSLVTLEEAGHCPHDERPDLVADIVYDWMTTSAETETLDKNNQETAKPLFTTKVL